MWHIYIIKLVRKNNFSNPTRPTSWTYRTACKMGNFFRIFLKECSENNFPIIDIVRFEVNVL